MPQRGPLTAYVAAIASAAAVVLAWAIPRVTLVQGLLVAGAVLVSEHFASRLREDVDTSLTNVIMLVTVMISGTPLAVVATLGAAPVFIRRVRHMPAVRVTFNVAQFALSAFVSGVTFFALRDVLNAQFVDVNFLLAVTGAAAVHSLMNNALVATAIALSTTERFWSAASTMLPAVLLQVPYVGIAVVAVVVLEAASPWALLLMAVPVVIARHGLLAFQRLDESYDRLVRGFVKAIEVKDLYTRGHSERVSELSVHVAEELGVPYDQRRLTRYAALLHDVGKIGVPLCIINKPGPLDEQEFGAMKQHPTIGAEILHDIDFLAPAIDIVRFHHERLDGRGYPHGIGGDDLSEIVRIVTVVDAFDAMTSTRSYRRALTVDTALEELRRCAGAQFDAQMVEALASVVDRVGWQPTVEFASADQLHGREIPVGTAQERLGGDPASEGTR